MLKQTPIAKLREAKKNSPLGKWLPGGSMSSSTRSKNYSNRDEEEEEETLESAPEADQAFVEHLQLELEEARRIIRSHEQKILALQDGRRSFWNSYDDFSSYLQRDAW